MNFSSFYKLFFENRELVGPVYHGGKWDGVSPIKMGRGALGTGAYFTPLRHKADMYAKENRGTISIAFLDIKNPLIIKTSNSNYSHPCVDALIQLGVEPKKAKNLVEKVEEEKGYLGKEISSRAIQQGYDAIFQYFVDVLYEIVIWNSDKVINKL